MLLGRLH